MTVRRVDLVENGPPVEVWLDSEVGEALASIGFVDARYEGHQRWSLVPLSKVGAVRVGALEVHVAPKVPVERLLFLVGYATADVAWRPETVSIAPAPDLVAAVATAFLGIAERAVDQGLLQGYRETEDTLPVLRGRIREADQIRRHYGLPLPVEVRYDDFTVDTADNRLLRAAVDRLRRLPAIPTAVRHRLLRLDRLLADVTLVRATPQLEPWRPTRLNARYHHALHLAAMIVRETSFDPGTGDVVVTGFVLNMAKIFEDFVCRALGDALAVRGGRVATQDPWHLDTGHQVALKPDLVWYAPDGRTIAVVDAKYKAERPEGFPNADVYQLLAYCTALGLPDGHLVYAKGNEAGAQYDITGAGVTVHAHTLDLMLPRQSLLAQVGRLAEHLAAMSAADALGA